MKFFSLIGGLVLLLPGPEVPPPAVPLRIAEQFVAPGGWPAMHEYLCCEVAGQARRQSLGQQIPAYLRRRCALLGQDSTRAVVAVELLDSAARADVYLHFIRAAGAWKLRAVRSLTLTGLGTPMLTLLTAMAPAEVQRYDQAHPAAPHAFAVGNLRLWVGADTDVGRHFSSHRAEFQQLVRLLHTRRYLRPDAPDPAADEQAANTDAAVRTRLQALFISRVGRHALGDGTGLQFLIGGRAGHTVGLLYQPEARALPRMSPEQVIMLRPLGGSWYLYKT